MKIGIFLPNATFDMPGAPEVGGIETFSFVVGEALQRLGHEVILFGGQPKAGRSHRATTLTLELHPYIETKSIPDIGTRFQRLVQRLHFARSIRHSWARHRVDLVLLAKPFDWPVAWWWKKARPELRTIMGFKAPIFFPVIAIFTAPSTQPSPSAQGWRISRRHIRANAQRSFPIRLIAESFTRSTRRFPQGHGASSEAVVSSAGKVFANLIEAVARLRRDHQVDAELTIAGEGTEGEPLRQRARDLGVAETIHFTGRLEPLELNAQYARHHLYCQPSIGPRCVSARHA